MLWSPHRKYGGGDITQKENNDEVHRLAAAMPLRNPCLTSKLFEHLEEVQSNLA